MGLILKLTKIEIYRLIVFKYCRSAVGTLEISFWDSFDSGILRNQLIYVKILF